MLFSGVMLCHKDHMTTCYLTHYTHVRSSICVHVHRIIFISFMQGSASFICDMLLIALSLCPPNRRGGVTYCFWCGSRRHPCSFLSALCLLNQCGWILAKLAQIHYWDWGKKWLGFVDHDLIFKVTPALWMSNFLPKKSCLHPISWTKWRILAKLYVL